MTDDEFLRQLEACTLPEALFDHPGHVRAGFAYLQREPFGAAIERMKTALIQYARSLGREGRYHDTITVAYLTLIREKMSQEPAGIRWEDFASRYPLLLDRDVLRAYYTNEELESAEARATFRLPRRM